jgi:hypothetical protein
VLLPGTYTPGRTQKFRVQLNFGRGPRSEDRGYRYRVETGTKDAARVVLTDRAQEEVGGAEGVVFWVWRNVRPDLWSGLFLFGVCFRVVHS